MKRLKLLLFSWVVTCFFHVQAFQANKGPSTTLSATKSLAQPSKVKKESKQSLKKIKPYSQLMSQRAILITITAIVVTIFVIILYLLIKKYRSNSNLENNSVDEERLRTAVINAVNHGSELNLSTLRMARRNVNSTILNSPIFENNTTALEYMISNRADEKILTILIDQERASQHQVEVTANAFQEVVLAMLLSDEEKSYLLKSLLPNLTAAVVNQKLFDKKKAKKGNTHTALDHAIEILYVEGFLRKNPMNANKENCYKSLIKQLLSQPHLKNAQLSPTAEGLARSLYLGLIDEQYHADLKHLRKEVDKAILNANSQLFDNRAGDSLAIEAVIWDINRLKRFQPESHTKIERAIAVADILLGEEAASLSLTALCFTDLIQALKSSDKVVRGRMVWEESNLPTEEKLFNLLEKMTQQASNDLINQALRYALQKYYPSFNPDNDTKQIQKSIFATLLNKQGLVITEQNSNDLQVYKIPIPSHEE